MSAITPPGPKPVPPPASPLGGAPVTEAPAAAGAVPAEGVEAEAPLKKSASLAGPEAVPSAPSVKGVAESFPVTALGKLEAKGVSGQTFLLDAGSLRGLKLQVRRVLDAGAPGFELMFQLTGSKLPPLLDAMKQKGASAVPLEFREVVLGEDGVATYGAAKAQVSTSSTHAPKDLDSQAAQWVWKLEGAKGGTLEVVHDKAALAVRGLVRIQLRGDDKACSKQLDGLLKSLGLAQAFAPPTDKSKRVFALMRVLWQADHAKAEELSKGDLDKLAVADLEAALQAAGYSKERIDGLRFEEVFDGHFTVVDPEQARALQRAGARYLYSTVTMPEHVHSILLGGQKSSLQRYKDGIIINGMSTNSDFITGGAQGVFTRVVTQDAIYDNRSWTGRTYKLLQTAEQLGRTDWYGWDGDFFGRRWELETAVNFGEALVKRVDAGGSYRTTNEFIFTAGNRPENIQRVIATTEQDRKKLIEHLSAAGYQPHNGLSLEEFVVLSPKFILFGAVPYDIDDLPAFLGEAKEKASQGQLSQLTWFLLEGPAAPLERAALEKELLLGADEKQRQVVYKAAKLTGELALGPALDGVIAELEGRGDAASQGVLGDLVTQMAEALFRSGGEKAVALLASKKGQHASSYQPYGLDDETWVRVMNALAKTPGVGAKQGLELALDTRAQSLLSSQHAGFTDFLATHPQVQPADPAGFVAEEIAKLKANQPSVQLSLYAAQALSSEARAQLEAELVRSDCALAVTILQSSLEGHRRLAMSGDTVKALLDELPVGSKTRGYLLSNLPDALLKLGHEGVFELLSAHYPSPGDFGIYDAKRWTEVVDELLAQSGGAVTPLLARVIERGANRLFGSIDFVKRLPALEGLFDAADFPAFVDAALQGLNGSGQLRLLWALSGPEGLAPHRKDLVRRLLEDPNYLAQNVLGRASELRPEGGLPLSAEALRELLQDLAAAEKKQPFYELVRRAGAQVLRAATAEDLALFDEVMKSEPDVVSKFDLAGNRLLEVLTSLRARTDADGPAAHTWLLPKAARYALDRDDALVLGHLSSVDATLADVGLTPAEAAIRIKAGVDKNSYYMTNDAYGSTPAYAQLPAGAGWLLMQGQAAPDEAVLEAMEAAIPSWNWSEALLGAFTKRAPGLTDEWKGRLEAARNKS